MNVKKIAVSLVCAAGIVGVGSAASLENVGKDVIPGEWTSSFLLAKDYAEKNGVPLLLFWSSSGCGQCNRMKTACNQANFVTWRKERKLIFVFSENDPVSKPFAKNPSAKFPYMRLYWPAGGVDEKFTGRTSTIPASGATLQQQLMNFVDSKIRTWINGDFDPGSGTSDSGTTPTPTPTPSVPTPGAEWKKARTLSGSYYTSDGLVVGRIVMKAGKMNKKGVAKIKVSVTDAAGKTKSSIQKAFTADATTEGSISGAFGTYSFSITGNNISGTFTVSGVSYEVKPLATGGSITDGTLTFSLLGYPENCQGNAVIDGEKYLPANQTFTSKSSRWKFDRKGTLKYDRRASAFVMSSTQNPSGLKLSYKTTTGFFKGSFTIYTKKTATMAKRYTANVTGFMVGGSGAGVATVRNVGSYSCTIKDEATLAAEQAAAEQAAAEQQSDTDTDEQQSDTDEQQ